MLYVCKGAHTLFTDQRIKRERYMEGERELKRGGEREM